MKRQMRRQRKTGDRGTYGTPLLLQEQETGGLMGHQFCYKKSVRNFRDLKFATQRFIVLLIEVDRLYAG
jgi:hypothetical protein